MYIPQIQPVQRNDNLLIGAAKILGEKRQQNALQGLLLKAQAGDPNALALAAAYNPDAAKVVSGIQEQQHQQTQQALVGGAITLLHAPPEQRPALYQQYLPFIKKAMPDAPDTYPGDDALNGYLGSVAAQGGDHGAVAQLALQGSGVIPQKPTDAQSNYGFLQGKTPEQQAQFMQVLHSSQNQAPKVVGLGGKLIGPDGKVLAENPWQHAFGPNEAAISFDSQGNPIVRATTGPGGAPLPPGMVGYPTGGTPVYNPQGQPISGPAAASGASGTGGAPLGGTTPAAITPEQQQQSLQDIEKAKEAGKNQGELLAKKPLAAGALREALAGADRVKATAKELLSNSEGIEGITGIKGSVPNYPGSKAALAANSLKNLVAQTEIGVISALKTASSTGATGFGQLSEKEGQILQNFIASLDLSDFNSRPDAKTFKSIVQKISDYTDGLKQRLSTAYNQTYGAEPIPKNAAEVVGTPKEAATAPSTNGGKTISLRALMSSPRAKGMTEAQVRQKAEAAGYTVQ